MRNRIIAAVLLAAVLVTGLGGALASPGTAEDPFITLNYLTETYYPELQQALLAQAQAGTAEIEQAALERLATLSDSYLSTLGDTSYSDAFLRLTLARNEKLTLPAGSSLQFEAGQVELTFSSGCLIDVTDGSTVTDPGTLTNGHYYIVAEDSACTVTALSDSVYLSVNGYYNLERTGIAYTPFVDITAKDWFADSVLYAYNEGLVNGMTPTTFEPMTEMNRAMIATLLSRMAGIQGTAADAGFTDVDPAAWYANGINWAYSVGIVNGMTDTTFEPTASPTREQLAVFLYRYATNYLGMQVPHSGDLSQFPDIDLVSGYAKDALSWAVGVGLVNGKDGNLAPRDKTNRAEIVTILQRFLTLYPY